MSVDGTETKTTLRVSPEDLAVIDERARAHGLSRTRFLVELGVGRGLPLTASEGIEERVVALECLMVRVRESLGLLGFEVDGNGVA